MTLQPRGICHELVEITIIFLRVVPTCGSHLYMHILFVTDERPRSDTEAYETDSHQLIINSNFLFSQASHAITRAVAVTWSCSRVVVIAATRSPTSGVTLIAWCSSKLRECMITPDRISSHPPTVAAPGTLTLS